MTVKELLEQLQDCNPEDTVILAKDSEGNDFSPMSEITEGRYVAESTWSGTVLLRELTPELVQEGYTEEDVGDLDAGAVNCVTIWPTN